MSTLNGLTPATELRGFLRRTAAGSLPTRRVVGCRSPGPQTKGHMQDAQRNSIKKLSIMPVWRYWAR